MKSFKSYLPLMAAVFISVFAGVACNTAPTANGGNAANGANNGAVLTDNGGKNGAPGNNTAPANGEKKSTKELPEMPSVIMNTQMKSLDGENFTLKQYEGKIILVNLWATWCGPCRMEMPELIKIEEEYKEKGVMVVGLDVDPEPEAMVKTFVERQKLNYKIGWAEQEVTEGFVGISKMNGIPQSFLISQDGRLSAVFKGFNPSGFAAKVRATLDEALARTTD